MPPRILILLLIATAVQASAQSDYRHAHITIDGGGGNSSSANYKKDSSISSLGAVVSSPDGHFVFRHGYTGELNEAPVVSQKTLARGQAASAKMIIDELLLNDFDPEGDFLVLTSINGTSTNGVSIEVDGSWVTYKGNPSNPLTDLFFYTVADSHGDVSIGQVLVSASPLLNIPNQNFLRIENIPSSDDKRIWFLGIPGRTYFIQASPSLNNPSWQTIGSAIAQPNGLYSFLDPDAANFPSRFYRGIRP